MTFHSVITWLPASGCRGIAAGESGVRSHLVPQREAVRFCLASVPVMGLDRISFRLRIDQLCCSRKKPRERRSVLRRYCFWVLQVFVPRVFTRSSIAGCVVPMPPRAKNLRFPVAAILIVF